MIREWIGEIITDFAYDHPIIFQILAYGLLFSIFVILLAWSIESKVQECLRAYPERTEEQCRFVVRNSTYRGEY